MYKVISLNNNYFNGAAEEIDSQYHNLLYRLNKLSKYNIVNSLTSVKNIEDATIVGVENNGCLKLKLSDGTISSYAFKEVEFIL